MCMETVLGAIGSLFTEAGGAAAVSAGSTAVSAAGIALSAVGSYQQAKAAKSAASYNAQVAELEAQDAKRRGENDRISAARKAAQLKGDQRSTMAARGLDLTGGTPLALLAQTDYFASVDQDTIRMNAEREAWRSRVKGTAYSNEASGYNPLMSAGTSLLSGIGSVASQWYGPKSAPVGKSYATLDTSLDHIVRR